ncbi:hypothetical protein PVAP13_1NG282719 [Panicum virgatum]|uniref:Uncharacterized protein n=1 Tax=Panicum virgatum TaxID=38727 RepID=A0A8T0X5V4_PANVG|nr:hypothetical protein PVAP13_1NG282719 [Panicum virgatum]
MYGCKRGGLRRSPHSAASFCGFCGSPRRACRRDREIDVRASKASRAGGRRHVWASPGDLDRSRELRAGDSCGRCGRELRSAAAGERVGGARAPLPRAGVSCNLRCRGCSSNLHHRSLRAARSRCDLELRRIEIPFELMGILFRGIEAGESSVSGAEAVKNGSGGHGHRLAAPAVRSGVRRRSAARGCAAVPPGSA